MDDFASGYVLGADSGNGNNGNGSFFNSDAIWAIIILAMFGFGGRGFGFGGGGFGGGGDCGAPCATQADVRAAVDHQSLITKLDGQTYGLADSTYALTNALTNGFHGVDSAICNLGFNMQTGFNTLGTQMANCCCETQRLVERGFCDVGYSMATNTANIIQAGHNDTDRVLAKLTDMEAARQAEKIEALRLENQTLKFAASQASQNAFITANQEAQTAELIRRLGRDCPVPAYVVPNPNCCYGNPLGVGYQGFGSTSGCGCGC